MNVDVRVPEAANVVAVGVAVVNVAEAAAEVGTEIVVVVVAEIGIETEIEIGTEIEIEIGIGAVGIVAETETETAIETVHQPTVVGNGSCWYEYCGSRRCEGVKAGKLHESWRLRENTKTQKQGVHNVCMNVIENHNI